MHDGRNDKSLKVGWWRRNARAESCELSVFHAPPSTAAAAAATLTKPAHNASFVFGLRYEHVAYKTLIDFFVRDIHYS